jgi:hypothetical protein
MGENSQVESVYILFYSLDKKIPVEDNYSICYISYIIASLLEIS